MARCDAKTKWGMGRQCKNHAVHDGIVHGVPHRLCLFHILNPPRDAAVVVLVALRRLGGEATHSRLRDAAGSVGADAFDWALSRLADAGAITKSYEERLDSRGHRREQKVWRLQKEGDMIALLERMVSPMK